MKYREIVVKEDKDILNKIKAKGISDYWLAQMIHKSYPYINMLRNGKAICSKKTYEDIKRIANK